MAASTALMQPIPSSSNTTTNSVGSKQILSSPLRAMSNGNTGSSSDSNSGTASDHDHSPLVVVVEQEQDNGCSLLVESASCKPTKRKIEQTCENEPQEISNDDQKTLDDYQRITANISTEEETIDEIMEESIQIDVNDPSSVTTNQINNCSLSSLINLEMSIKQSLANVPNAKSDHSTVKSKNSRQSTGKLERITERLAKKQNGAIPLISKQNDDTLNTSLAQNDHRILTNTEFADNAQDKVESKSNLPKNNNDEMNEEDDEEIKNGFRALGLMGNVAFLGDESFKCPVCGLKLDSQHTFTLHIRSHNPNDHSNTCSLCGKTLSSASSLDRHMLIHSGERPFKCSLCGMAFTTNGNMHRHMRTHGHGSIGYTPRGQKRRAKLLTQALEKAVAAAAAGEQVDFEAINKLKKSILESKVTPPPPTSISTSSKRNHKSAIQSSSNSFSEQILSSLAPNVSIEAAAAAAVAAAHNKSNRSSNLNTHHGTGRKQITKDGTKSAGSSLSSSSCSSVSNNSSTSHCGPISNNMPTDTNSPLNLAHNSLLTGCWPQSGSEHSLNHLISTPIIQPEKGRPGRKKKQRLSLNAFGNGSSTSNASGTVSNDLSSVPSSSSPKMHTSTPNGSYEPIKAPSRCPICAHPIRNTTELHVHMMAYHLQERLFCNDCGMILDNYDTYTHHHCTASAATVMTALSQNPTLRSDLLFCSSNTSRMNFSSARTYAANLEMLRGLTGAGQAAAHLLTAAQLANLNQYNRKNHFSQSLMDLSQSQQPTINKYSSCSIVSQKSGHSTNCNQCNKKFGSSKELKYHHDTYCHHCSLECDSVSTYQLHQFSHSFEKLNPQLNADKMQLLKNAAAFSLLPSMANNHLISPALTSPLQLSNKLGRESVPPPPSSNTDQSETPTSIASLSSMANMKPDLADIESILSIVHGTTAKDGKHTTGNQLRSPISPNRASDAGDFGGVHRVQVNGGEATNQPDSPASADSAAAAVVSSSLASSLNSEGQHSTKTDLNNTENDSALCLKQKNDESCKLMEKKDSTTDNMMLVNESNKVIENESTDKKGSEENSIPLVCSPLSKSDNGEIETKSDKRSDQQSCSGSSSSSSNRFRCESCRLSFKSMNALRRHNRGHTAGGGHSHACHLCPYKSLDKSTLIRHLRTHNGERPFQCSICKYAFTTKANCERHVRKRHRNLKSKSEIRSAMQYNRDMAATAAATRLVSEKIFIERDQLPTSQDTICKKCEIDFGSNRELRAHLRVPNNPCSQQLKPFVCMICNIGFNTRNNCVRHIIKQHPSTIEVSEEDAAKAVAAAVDAESLMIETGSSSSLSPASNGQISNRSSFSSSISTTSSDHLSECESYGTYDEPESELNNGTSGSKYRVSGTNSSFAALCQVAKQVNRSVLSPLNLSKKSDEDLPIPVEEDVDDEEEPDANFDQEIYNEVADTETEPTTFILDLSFKTK